MSMISIFLYFVVWHIHAMQGNVLYKEGEFEAAVECYSKGMMLDPLSAALPANRALTLLKLERLVLFFIHSSEGNVALHKG
jgi:hypothetical protein